MSKENSFFFPIIQFEKFLWFFFCFIYLMAITRVRSTTSVSRKTAGTAACTTWWTWSVRNCHIKEKNKNLIGYCIERFLSSAHNEKTRTLKILIPFVNIRWDFVVELIVVEKISLQIILQSRDERRYFLNDKKNSHSL